MGILKKLFASLENPATPVSGQALVELLGGRKSDAGVTVTEERAMKFSTVYACIKVIAEDLASMPFSVLERQPDSSEREAIEHRLYAMLHDTPNDYQTAMVFREALIACTLLWGNGYALIKRDFGRRPSALQLMPPDKTHPLMVDGKLWYVTTATEDGRPLPIASADMIHIPAISFDGITGISPIRNCMQAVGLGIATEKFGAQFFGNGARSTGVFTHPGSLDEEAYVNLKNSIREWATDDNALRPVVLEEGLKWDQLTIPPNEAQFLETRRFQRSEIASIYRVPLHLIQDLDRSTNNNIEHQDIEYVKHTLRPLATRIEQEFNRKLLVRPFHCEHDMHDLQRGDWASQTAGFASLRDCGAFSANDIRRRLRENPIPASEGGNLYLAPLNMTSLANLAQMPQLATPGPSSEKLAA